MIELLSPAGDLESVKAAILYGADAVYLGGDFGLRVNAGFTDTELQEAVEYVHSHGKKVYLTCNIVANNDDIDRFRIVSDADGIIVSDLGVFDLIIKAGLPVPVHISTQAGVMNYASANMLHKLGASRVILARETSLSEIKRIREETPAKLELEAFVHGAMCMGFSGRCLISNYLAGRDANRGTCAQPCRWEYSLVESTRPNESFPITENERGSYIMNSKDLCMIEHIKDLADAGVTTFKIEGRAKTAYYTAIITNAYRAAISAYERGESCPEWALREVNCVSHRPYCTGFYFGSLEENANIEPTFSGYIRDCDFVAVTDCLSTDAPIPNTIEIIQRNHFTIEENLEIVIPGSKPIKLEIAEMYNKKGESVTVANKATEKLWIKTTVNCQLSIVNCFVRRVNK